MRRVVLLLGAILVLLAGCGGSHHSSATHKQADPPATILAQHPCVGVDFYANCVLREQGAIPAPSHRLTVTAATGIDFAWSCPSPAGRGFGFSYLSGTSKDWTRSCLNWWHANGKPTGAVWETTATRATDGWSAGFSDARSASNELAALGAPAGQPIVLAIDCDCTGSSLDSYFQGANAAEPHRVNAYGGYSQVLHLFRAGLVGHYNWQTLAWSGGAWLPASIAPVEQVAIGPSIDWDRAIATYYGQWPAPHVGPSAKTLNSWRKARHSAIGSYRRAKCSAPQQKLQTPAGFGSPNACAQNAAAVVKYQAKLWTVYKRWPCFGPGAREKTDVCSVVRPEVSWWSHARRSSWLAYHAKKCPGPVYRAKGHRGACGTYSQRWRFFNAQANQTVRKYS